MKCRDVACARAARAASSKYGIPARNFAKYVRIDWGVTGLFMIVLRDTVCVHGVGQWGQ